MISGINSLDSSVAACASQSRLISVTIRPSSSLMSTFTEVNLVCVEN